MVRTIEPMTHGRAWKRIVCFALPIMLGNLFQQLYNTVDSLFVGNYLGSDALAAVSSSGSLIFLLIGFLQGITIGAGVVIAKLFGSGDQRRLGLSIHTTVAFGLVSGVVMTVLCVTCSPQILRWMGTPESVLPLSIVYLRIFFAGSLFLVMYNVFVGILQALGDSRHPFYYLVVSSLLNFVLDWILIAHVGVGVEGAAWATVISQFVSAFLCFIQLVRMPSPYGLRLRRIGFDWRLLGQVIHLGLPSGVQNSIIAFANIVVQSYVNSFGNMAVAGYGAYCKIEGFGFLPITSFAMATTTFVGQNLGAKEYDRARAGARFGIASTVTMSELIGLVLVLFAPVFISAFDSTPAVVQFGVDKARLTGWFFFLLSFSHAVAAVMRGAGRAVVPMCVMIFFWCVVRTAFLSVMVPWTGSIYAVYWVYPLTWFLSSVVFLWYYLKGNWIHGLD